jgi:hypothetical protein
MTTPGVRVETIVEKEVDTGENTIGERSSME